MKIMPLILTLCLLASFGCDVGVGDFTGLDTETLTVSVTTVGTNLDPDGYRLRITGEDDAPIGVNETKNFAVLSIRITVQLLDVAANCAVADDSVTVDVNGPTSVAFFVECT